MLNVTKPQTIARAVAALTLFYLATSDGSAAGLTASLDREVVPVGESVTLTLSFENVSPQGAPNLPPLPNVTLGPVGQSTQMTIVNGQRSVRQTYSYTLVATAPGDTTIPAISVLASGQLVTSQPLKLKIVPADAAAATTPQTAFLRLMVPKTELYVGEALPVEITLHVQEGRDAHLPQLEGQGFTIGKMLQTQQSRTQIGGQVFNLVPFKTYVAPARAGQLQLGPATMALTIPKPNARRTVFGVLDSDWQRVTLRAEAQPLNVLPLPTPAPESFNGAIGTYSLQVNAGPTNVAVGDPITVKVQLSGRGLLDSLALPAQPQWRDFTAYPPSSSIASGDQHNLSGVKTFEQVLIPQNHELKVLSPFEFTFFDPQQKSFRTLKGPAFPLTIRPTASAAPPLVTNANTGQNRPEPVNDILHIKPTSAAVAMSPPLIQQPWFLALQAVPLVAWVSLLASRRRREALANNPRLRRQRQVAHRVRSGLKELRELAAAQQSDQFFASLFRLLQEQLGERLDLPASSITEAVIDERLRDRGLSQATIDGLHELFQLCNQARYAPQRSSQELESLIPKAERVLTELQQWKSPR